MSFPLFFHPDPNTEDCMCRVCGTVLTVGFRHQVGFGFFHSVPDFDTHMPDPVPVREMINTQYFCDFCCQVYLEEALGTVYTKNMTAFGGQMELQLSGEWAICNDCKVFIEADDWDGLLERHLNIVSPMMGEPRELTRANIKPLFDVLRHNIDRIE